MPRKPRKKQTKTVCFTADQFQDGLRSQTEAATDSSTAAAVTSSEPSKSVNVIPVHRFEEALRSQLVPVARTRKRKKTPSVRAPSRKRSAKIGQTKKTKKKKAQAPSKPVAKQKQQRKLSFAASSSSSGATASGVAVGGRATVRFTRQGESKSRPLAQISAPPVPPQDPSLFWCQKARDMEFNAHPKETERVKDWLDGCFRAQGSSSSSSSPSRVCILYGTAGTGKDFVFRRALKHRNETLQVVEVNPLASKSWQMTLQESLRASRRCVILISSLESWSTANLTTLIKTVRPDLRSSRPPKKAAKSKSRGARTQTPVVSSNFLVNHNPVLIMCKEYYQANTLRLSKLRPIKVEVKSMSVGDVLMLAGQLLRFSPEARSAFSRDVLSAYDGNVRSVMSSLEFWGSGEDKKNSSAGSVVRVCDQKHENVFRRIKFLINTPNQATWEAYQARWDPGDGNVRKTVRLVQTNFLRFGPESASSPAWSDWLRHPGDADKKRAAQAWWTGASRPTDKLTAWISWALRVSAASAGYEARCGSGSSLEVLQRTMYGERHTRFRWGSVKVECRGWMPKWDKKALALSGTDSRGRLEALQYASLLDRASQDRRARGEDDVTRYALQEYVGRYYVPSTRSGGSRRTLECVSLYPMQGQKKRKGWREESFDASEWSQKNVTDMVHFQF